MNKSFLGLFLLLQALIPQMLVTKTAKAAHAIINFGTAGDLVYRGGRLEGGEDNFRDLHQLGVTTIINLDTLIIDDRDFCRSYGFSCLRHPLSLMPGRERFLKYERLAQALSAVQENRAQGKGTYIHCYHGSDRTGALAAAIHIQDTLCQNPNYNREQLRQKVKSDLLKYGFHGSMFPNLYKTILSWTETPPLWICNPSAPVPAPTPALAPATALEDMPVE